MIEDIKKLNEKLLVELKYRFDEDDDYISLLMGFINRNLDFSVGTFTTVEEVAPILTNIDDMERLVEFKKEYFTHDEPCVFIKEDGYEMGFYDYCIFFNICKMLVADFDDKDTVKFNKWAMNMLFS